MVPSPLPYDPRWVTKLLRRDVRALRAKATAKVKKLLAPSSAPCSPPSLAPKTTTPPQEQAVGLPVTEPEDPHYTEGNLPASDLESPKTSYSVLEGHLKDIYIARDREMSHEDRWRFRGSWLVLWMALQSYPSNDSYKIFEGKRPDESALQLALMKDCANAANVSSPPAPVRQSKVPALPYQGSGPRVRYDSLISAITVEPRTPTSSISSKSGHDMGTSGVNVSNIATIAEGLLADVWPEKNAADIISSIGQPDVHLQEYDELRFKLRDLLFPGYETFISL